MHPNAPPLSMRKQKKPVRIRVKDLFMIMTKKESKESLHFERSLAGKGSSEDVLKPIN